MAVIIDPEEKEIAALRQAANWRDMRVLETGCGDGRLTLRLAQLGAQVVAFDPNPTLIHKAQQNLPERFVGRVEYCTGSAEMLQHPDASFDLVVLSWSLC
ncbi:class I SAM-dependent methyltransferase [candidate division KSB1 bacterium]|nr:class I SAM-dependent methyltransferase [candidate division KSB1 bacterium]